METQRLDGDDGAMEPTRAESPGERGRRGAVRSKPGAGRAGLLLLLVTLAVPPALAETAGDGGTEEPADGGRIELRSARAPGAEERAAVERWHRAWRREAAPLEALLGPLGATGQPARVGNPRWCRALAEALLTFDRSRALDGPCRAADFHLRRAVDRLVLGAAACLEGRLYAAAHRMGEARRAFAEAEEVLEPYGVRP